MNIGVDRDFESFTPRSIFFLLLFFIETYFGVVYIYTILRGFADTQCDYLLCCNDIKTISPIPATCLPLNRGAGLWPKGILFISAGRAIPLSGGQL